MEGSTQDSIITALKDRYEDQILHIDTPYDFLTISLKQEKIVEIIQYLYNHPDTKFQYLTTLAGIHYPELKQIAVMYQLHNLVANKRIRLKIFLPEEKPVTPTITHIFAGANWLERETYDFFGVIFEGHPNLKRILNVDDMIIFPLRKEYPLEDQRREDKNDTMFGR
ncbi:NADH-quinone oxidoreductase subunit C [Ohtaekwangia sp.]|jgi:NADH-quinone oxidoreductase subunit C|uniref:NADH-quinone oxidoreductase subunit C n=1 Tax=Ohtaekwangia sp. TaxID=2066019 RepID=UPI002F924365